MLTRVQQFAERGKFVGERVMLSRKAGTFRPFVRARRSRPGEPGCSVRGAWLYLSLACPCGFKIACGCLVGFPDDGVQDHDAFTDQGSQVSYYRAEIQLNDGEMARLPATLHLIPGMPVEAFISTDARSPMAYLLKPLADYFVKAFRET